MTTKNIQTPFNSFNDLSGNPLENGKIYIGEANKNPEVYPISVYWDSGSTIPAAQPIRTINGYLSQNGRPGTLFANSDYSITVRDKNDGFIFSSFSAESLSDSKTFSGSGASGGTTVKTISLADNSGAIIEVYGSGLKGSDMAISKASFSIWRKTGAMTINKMYDDEFIDGDIEDAHFEMETSGIDAVLKAYVSSGTWVVSGQIRILSGLSVNFT